MVSQASLRNFPIAVPFFVARHMSPDTKLPRTRMIIPAKSSFWPYLASDSRVAPLGGCRRTPYPYNNGRVRDGPKAELTGGGWLKLVTQCEERPRRDSV
ncbi:unnamed protein product [Cuscuta europaea]|uniref:Uncharacterized protein n=1 Tax=Cuscuta europaea TaxID=41803 RepID=A0A9P0Z2D9_CUSEU|nr:unnamed protein product [Cuscuta europaea]